MSFLSAIQYPPLDPVVFQFGPLAVRWYGLAYVLAFAIGYFTLRHLTAKGHLRTPADALAGLVGWLTFGVLIGGRLGWWLWYHEPAAADSWYEPLAIWHGGMSFHGGLLGVVLALGLWTWLQRVSFWNVADCLAMIVPIGLFFGRIANFINAELRGRPTEVPWGVIFPGETIARHPSQLYEAILEGPILLLILWLARKTLPSRDGQTAGLFLVGYGVLRFLVEFTRQPDEQLGFIAFGWLTMGQLLSAGLLLAGAAILLARRGGEKSEKHVPSNQRPCRT